MKRFGIVYKNGGGYKKTRHQEGVTLSASVADPECLSWILIFVYPGSRIPDSKTATKERDEKNLLSYLFL
jgi:hypothetical protein